MILSEYVEVSWNLIKTLIRTKRKLLKYNK